MDFSTSLVVNLSREKHRVIKWLVMLRHADAAQNETVERLKHVLRGRKILFTLVGSAGCREYGLSRTANDLDFVVDPYELAMEILDASGQFEPVSDDHPDTTLRTCTKRDTKIGIKVDFLKSGIRINDGSRWVMGRKYRDPMPISTATGTGDVAPLATLIAMKLNAAISGEYILEIGANTGRSREKIQKDISDVRELIAVCGLDRNLQVGNDQIQRRYGELVDENRSAASPSLT
jgi:hypothetical protein